MAVFRVGQRVVCVDASANFLRLFSGLSPWLPLRAGEIYTVIAVQPSTPERTERLSLAEIPQKGLGWQSRRFRPAVDIEQFRRLVEPANLPKLRELEPANRGNPS